MFFRNPAPTRERVVILLLLFSLLFQLGGQCLPEKPASYFGDQL